MGPSIPYPIIHHTIPYLTNLHDLFSSYDSSFIDLHTTQIYVYVLCISIDAFIYIYLLISPTLSLHYLFLASFSFYSILNSIFYTFGTSSQFISFFSLSYTKLTNWDGLSVLYAHNLSRLQYIVMLRENTKKRYFLRKAIMF